MASSRTRPSCWLAPYESNNPLKTSVLTNLRMASAGNPLSLVSVPSMKTHSYLLWILGVVLALASVDTIPDPPAVNPHTVSVVSQFSDSGASGSEQRLNNGWFCFSSQLHAARIAFTSASEPSLPRDSIVLTGQAADTSPPSRVSRQL